MFHGLTSFNRGVLGPKPGSARTRPTPPLLRGSRVSLVLGSDFPLTKNDKSNPEPPGHAPSNCAKENCPPEGPDLQQATHYSVHYQFICDRDGDGPQQRIKRRRFDATVAHPTRGRPLRPSHILEKRDAASPLAGAGTRTWVPKARRDSGGRLRLT